MEKFFCGRGTGEGYLFQRSHKYPSPVPGTGTEFFLVLGRFLVWRREESGKIFLKREKSRGIGKVKISGWRGTGGNWLLRTEGRKTDEYCRKWHNIYRIRRNACTGIAAYSVMIILIFTLLEFS